MSSAASQHCSHDELPCGLSEATQNEEFVVVDGKDSFEQFPSHFQSFPALQWSVRQDPGRVDVAVQCDYEAGELDHFIDVKNRCIEDLQMKIHLQEVEIASIKQELDTYKKKYGEKRSSICHACVESCGSWEHVHVQSAQTAVNECELPSLSQKCFDGCSNQLQRHPHSSPHPSTSQHPETAEKAAAVPTHKEFAASASGVLQRHCAVGCWGEAEITNIMNRQIAICRGDCENLISSLCQRMEKAQAELRDQCFEYCAASERRLRQEMSAEREKARSCFREMALLRDYVTSMTDVVETMTSSYMPKADATTSKGDTGKASQCDTMKTPPAT